MEQVPPAPDSRDALNACEAFSELPPDLVDQVFARMDECTFEKGERLIEQGQVGESVMVVLAGTAHGELRAAKGNEARTVGTFGPGEVVGEMALVTRQPRTADVLADSAMRVLRLPADDFQELAFQNPELGMVLTSIVAKRLGEKSIDGMGGKTVGDYQIRRSVGRGGMAVVYEAEHIESKQRVALKMMSYRLLYQRGAMARFQREANTLKALDDPNIARVFETFSALKTSFIVMEFCDGPALDRFLAEHGPLTEAEARPIIGQLARALDHMHAMDVIHRDLKPSNVLMTSKGVAKLTDFGLAKTLDTNFETPLTESRMLLGTPLYMSPEQISGDEATPAADIYALGCIAWEMMHLEPPVVARNFLELARGKGMFELPPREAIAGGISRGFHEFLDTCLQMDPKKRNVDITAIKGWAEPVDMTPYGDAS